MHRKLYSTNQSINTAVQRIFKLGAFFLMQLTSHYMEIRKRATLYAGFCEKMVFKKVLITCLISLESPVLDL